MHTQTFRPATREMRFWGRILRPPVFPVRDHVLARILRFALVTPLAHFANLSLDFQTYLYLVFHRHPASRVVHLLAMPLIVTSLIAVVARHVAGDTAAIVLSALLAAWYLVQSLTNRLALFGVFMVVLVAAYLALGIAWAELAAGAGLWADPLVGFLVFVSVQTFSHAAEPDVPPRVSGTEDWVPLPRFVFGPKGARHSFPRSLARMGRLGLASLAGAFDEIWGSPRLLPIVVLTLMWKFGYQKERRDEIEALAAAALTSGNPGIDRIGIGGGRLAPSAAEVTP
ncbi:MAG: hypothetical protein R6V85_06105 [Polyangia bacterium]